jgi:transposase
MGRKTLKVQGYVPEQIKALIKEEDLYTIGIKLFAIYQVSLGKSTREVSSLFNISFKQVTNWLHRFEKEGTEGLRKKPKKGRPSRLSQEQMEELRKVIQSSSPEDYGYNTATWNGILLREYIKNQFGVKFQKAQIYNLLKKLGFTYQKGRGKYPEADEEKRKEFKETLKKTSGRA